MTNENHLFIHILIEIISHNRPYTQIAVECALETIEQHLYPFSSTDYLSALAPVVSDNDRGLKSLQNSNFHELPQQNLMHCNSVPWQSNSALLSTKEEVLYEQCTELEWNIQIRKGHTSLLSATAPEHDRWIFLNRLLKSLRFGFVSPVGAIINVVRIDAPKSIIVGQPITLKCFIEIRNDKLVSLSWLKDNSEFYRYQPGEKQRELYFRVKGVNVEVSAEQEIASN